MREERIADLQESGFMMRETLSKDNQGEDMLQNGSLSGREKSKFLQLCRLRPLNKTLGTQFLRKCIFFPLKTTLREKWSEMPAQLQVFLSKHLFRPIKTAQLQVFPYRHSNPAASSPRPAPGYSFHLPSLDLLCSTMLCLAPVLLFHDALSCAAMLYCALLCYTPSCSIILCCVRSMLCCAEPYSFVLHTLSCSAIFFYVPPLSPPPC
jgi:hypothetical protein